jgi:2-polyprenyl-3-methyl-5-hydroxy-6-metoxy-1,4-benzoquinol methylase
MFFKTELTPDTDMAIIQAPFDVIVSLLVLHHIPDVTGQLKLLAKCLKPGGRLVIFDLLLNENSRDFHPLVCSQACYGQIMTYRRRTLVHAAKQSAQHYVYTADCPRVALS